MSNFTLLAYRHCSNMSEEYLEVFKKIGSSGAELTDFARLFNDEYKSGKAFWTRDITTQSRLGKAKTERELMTTRESSAFATDGKFGHKTSVDGKLGVRIAMPYSTEIPFNVGSRIVEQDGVKYAEYGYYPQGAVARDVQESLEKAFKERLVTETGKKYTIPSMDDKKVGVTNLDRIVEYEYQGKKYVRTHARFNDTQLSTGERVQKGEFVCIEVQPVRWLIDEKTKQMITDKVILSGMQFDIPQTFERFAYGKYYPKQRRFDKTLIKQFIDECWSKEIESSTSKKLLRKN